jgi:hypothetical protein
MPCEPSVLQWPRLSYIAEFVKRKRSLSKPSGLQRCLKHLWKQRIDYRCRPERGAISYRGACRLLLKCEGVDSAATLAIHGRALQTSREIGKGYPLGDDPSALTAFEVWLRAINASDELALEVWVRDDYTAGVSLSVGDDFEP